MKKKAAVLWSGGKDCNLALYLARQEYNVIALVTFCSVSTEFRAHPVAWMEKQSEALGIPHSLILISEPFADNYERQLQKLKSDAGIEVLVSGDISEVHGAPNWLSERGAAVGMNVFLPLWHKDREEVMDLLLKYNFEVILTMVKSPWLNESFVGRTINPELIGILKLLGTKNGLDLCGEQGEYHTMVINGPGYRSPVSLNKYQVVQHEELFHLSEIGISLTISAK
ncbi:diphthine--ammonia ligase [Fluviicola sp.]|uniref:Dph6-related ATP pyrophosphatase n=1 Tax=Fluviicola sp. TaxID=1917219 RepID=UPI0031CF3CBC